MSTILLEKKIEIIVSGVQFYNYKEYNKNNNFNSFYYDQEIKKIDQEIKKNILEKFQIPSQKGEEIWNNLETLKLYPPHCAKNTFKSFSKTQKYKI